jgi:hypothetical protein
MASSKPPVLAGVDPVERGKRPSIADVGVSMTIGDAESRLKEHMPPCVVLVINDNPYGLMFALSYIYRTCP